MEQLLRITIPVRRKPGTSEAAFHHYWAHVHGPLVRAWLIRHGIVRYVQYHAPAALQRATPVVPQCDGWAEFWVRTWGDWEAALGDEEYLGRIREDERRFLDMDGLGVMVGCEVVVVEEGRVAGQQAWSFEGAEGDETEETNLRKGV